MGTENRHGYVIPPRYWSWITHPYTLRVLCWLAAIGTGWYQLDHASQWLSDSPNLPEEYRRPEAHGYGHTQIDFGGQWVMGRMLVTGHGRELYHRQVQWGIVRAGFPVSDETAIQREETLLPSSRWRLARSQSDVGHDADRMMYWFMGSDPPAWKTVGGSAVVPLAFEVGGNPLATIAREWAAAEAVTPAVVAEVEAPAIGGPLYPPIHAFFYAPLGRFDRPHDAYQVFQVFALGCTYLAGLGVCVLTRGRVWWSVASLGVLLYPGLRAGLDLGQNPMISLCILVWGWVLVSRKREWVGGAVWGLFAFKPVWGMAFFLVPLLMGRWRMCLAMVGTGAALAAFTLPEVGLQAWFDWLQVGAKAAGLYNQDGNWISLSRDLQGIPRRFLVEFDRPEQERDTPGIRAVAWGLWGLVFATTILVYLLRADRRKPLGLGAAFLFLGAFLTCYRFMYYDVLLSVMGFACLFAEPGRLFRACVFPLRFSSQPTAFASQSELLPASPNPLGPRMMGYVASFPLTVLAGLYLLENVLSSLGVEATFGIIKWAGVTTGADGATTFSTPRVRVDSMLFYPWDTVLIIALWAWCGVRLVLKKERA